MSLSLWSLDSWFCRTVVEGIGRWLPALSVHLSRIASSESRPDVCHHLYTMVTQNRLSLKINTGMGRPVYKVCSSVRWTSSWSLTARIAYPLYWHWGSDFLCARISTIIAYILVFCGYDDSGNDIVVITVDFLSQKTRRSDYFTRYPEIDYVIK